MNKKQKETLELLENALASLIFCGRLEEAEKISRCVGALYNKNFKLAIEYAEQSGIMHPYMIWNLAERFGVDYGKPVTTSGEQGSSSPPNIPSC